MLSGRTLASTGFERSVELIPREDPFPWPLSTASEYRPPRSGTRTVGHRFDDAGDERWHPHPIALQRL
jgi:hypothetical protein